MAINCGLSLLSLYLELFKANTRLINSVWQTGKDATCRPKTLIFFIENQKMKTAVGRVLQTQSL